MTPREKIMKNLLKKDDVLTYSGCIRELNKSHPELIVPFMKSFKKAFLMAHQDGVDGPEAVALLEAFQTLSSTAQFAITLMKVAGMKDPIGAGRAIATIINYMLENVDHQQLQAYRTSLKNKISKMNEKEIAGKEMPEGAVLGQALTFIKTILNGNDALYVRNVLKSVEESL